MGGEPDNPSLRTDILHNRFTGATREMFDSYSDALRDRTLGKPEEIKVTSKNKYGQDELDRYPSRGIILWVTRYNDERGARLFELELVPKSNSVVGRR